MHPTLRHPVPARSPARPRRGVPRYDTRHRPARDRSRTRPSPRRRRPLPVLWAAALAQPCLRAPLPCLRLRPAVPGVPATAAHHRRRARAQPYRGRRPRRPPRTPSPRRKGARVTHTTPKKVICRATVTRRANPAQVQPGRAAARVAGPRGDRRTRLGWHVDRRRDGPRRGKGPYIEPGRPGLRVGRPGAGPPRRKRLWEAPRYAVHARDRGLGCSDQPTPPRASHAITAAPACRDTPVPKPR